MTSSDALGYDELPYPSAPYPYSHPDHLCVVARLFGLTAADPPRGRVLEVGCADGANLLPIAWNWPESQCVGIDLSRRQIETGQALARRLGIHNVDLRHQDLLEFDPGSESVDFLIAHGIYSWTPPATRRELLALCRRSLAPQGIAFLSFNVFPGWRTQTALRTWLLDVTRDITSTTQRLAECRRRMTALRAILGEQPPTAQQGLATTLDRLLGWSDGYLRHDLLEEHNHPVHFAEFLRDLESHDLRYFADADVASMVGAGMSPRLVTGLARLGGSPAGREQLFDLVTERTFRQAIVARREAPVASRLETCALDSLYVASCLRRVTSAGPAPVRFEARSGFAIDVESPEIAWAFDRLAAAWPASLPMIELAANEVVRERLNAYVLAAFVERAVELHATPARFVTTVSERPVASAYAREQARTAEWVTSQRHDVAPLDPLARAVLERLDGAHSLDDLARLPVWNGEQPDQVRPQLGEMLRKFQQLALLVG